MSGESAPDRAPPPIAIDQRAIATSVHRAALDAIRLNRNPDGVAAMAREAARRNDRAWNEVAKRSEARERPDFACGPGCAWCCTQLVTVSPAETIAIARHVAATFPPEALAALKQRLAALDDKARGLGAFARGCLKTACALLVDGKCSVYEVRPIRCRSVYSRDLKHCIWVSDRPDQVYEWRDRMIEKSPYPPEPEAIADAALDALAVATRDAGLEFRALELTAALRIALDTIDVAERYLAGEPVFAGAQLAESPEAGMPPDRA